MKKSIFVFVVIALFVSLVHAISVELIDPRDRTTIQRERINNILFTCNISGASESRLYTTISGSWQQTGTRRFGDDANGRVSFIALNVTPGTYRWNCLAIGEQGTIFAPNNFTFTFEFLPNEPPRCTGTFPTITLERNGPIRTNVLNLHNFFTDPENDTLTFAYSGAGNVFISIRTNGSIDMEPAPNTVGRDQIYFRANDGRNSDVQCGPMPVNIIESRINQSGNQSNQTPQNTPPRITPDIPDQNKTLDIEFWTLNLNSYVEDSQDSDSNLNWSIEGIDEDIVEITINQISKKVTFTPVGIGDNIVTFIVKDTGNLQDTQNVKITITESDSEELPEEEITEPLKIESHLPGSSNPQLTLGSNITFFIDLNKPGANVVWYVNGIETKKGLGIDNFDFGPDKEGIYNITVEVEIDGETDSYSWKLNVKKPTISAKEQNLCGNSIADANETCLNCPEDIVCKDNEECTPNGCISKSKITGAVITNLPLNAKLSFLIGIVIIFIVSMIIIKVKNKKKNKKLTSFLGKQEVLIKPEATTKKITIKELIKENKSSTSGLEPIIGFIQSGLATGDSERTIKKALLKSGWGRKQVKLAFKSIKK